MARSRAVTIRRGGFLAMTAFVAIALSDSARDVVPYWEFVLAAGVILSWMLGQRYERELVVDAELAERDDVLEAERDAEGWLL